MNGIHTINLESLPPYYRKACGALRQNLLAATTNEEKFEHCEKFLKSYFMIPPLWCDFFELLQDMRGPQCIIEMYANQALSQFYSEKLYPYLVLSSKPFTKTMEASQYLYAKITDMSKEQLEDGFSYPHEHLDDLYYQYIRLTESPMPPKLCRVYQSSKMVYNKLCEVYNDEAKWMKALTALPDLDFVKQNIEARIAREFLNKKLWKLYIRYLESTNDMWILLIYCRYCNFFIEDLGMREKYLDKIEHYAKLEEPVSRWWIDAISFTFNHGTPEDIKELIQKALHLASLDFTELHMFFGYDLEDIVPKKMFKELRPEIEKTFYIVRNRNKKWSTYFPTSFLCQKPFIYMGDIKSLSVFDREIFKENRALRFIQSRRTFAPTPFKTPKFVPQYFSLTKPIMWYIMKNASFAVRIKLYKSCKYFYYEKRLVPVYSIKVEGTHPPPPPQHHFPPGFPVPGPPPKAKSKEHSLSCSIRHQSFQHLNDLWITGIFVSIFNDSTQQIMSKVKKFEPVIIHLQSQTIPLTTFQKLMEGNSCKVLKLEETFFTHADGTTRANLNEILQASSSVVDYTFCCQNLAVNNQELSKLVLKNKIQRFTFEFANELLEIPTFLQFLKKNAAPLCKIEICYDETANVQYRIQMKEALKLFNNEMPTFCGKDWIMYKFKDHSF